MAQFKRYTPFALAILAAVMIQLVFIWADCKDTPNRAVIEFSKAYFMLDPAMADRLCRDRQTIGDVDIVAVHLYLATERAKQRGFRLNYMKTRLYDIKTRVLKKDDSSAEVNLHGKRRFAMNPLFAIVAQVFGFSKPQVVDETFTVRKENGSWKVCGSPFDLPSEA